MVYTKEQLQEAMKKYYKDINENPNDYKENPKYDDQEAIDTIDHLLTYID